MITLSAAQRNSLRHWFLPERPGPLVGVHVLQTGHGRLLADRWPQPRMLLAATSDNYSLHGSAEAVSPAELRTEISGFVEAGPDFEPLLRQAFPELQIWPRMIFEPGPHTGLLPPDRPELRRLQASDAGALQGLDPVSAWISKTWGGAAGLATSGYAWAAVVNGVIASVACTFFLGTRYEEIGVVTEPGLRGHGLSTLCAAALCHDIRARGHLPSWTTSDDNHASLRVAGKLGFTLQRRDRLYVAGIAIPPPNT